MKEINTYIVLESITRGTSPFVIGRYEVGAKSEKEAEKLLRKVKPLAKLKVYYKEEPKKHDLRYKEIYKEVGAERIKIQ